MKKPNALTDVRRVIDTIGHDLVGLFVRRQRLVEKAGELKQGQPDQAVKGARPRGRGPAARRADAEAAGLDPDVAEQVWRAMIDAFIAVGLRVHSPS